MEDVEHGEEVREGRQSYHSDEHIRTHLTHASIKHLYAKLYYIIITIIRVYGV